MVDEFRIHEEHWSYSQKATMAIAPKISSSLSILGSSYIIYKSLSKIISKRNNRHNYDNVQRIRDRIFIALSICDFLSSIAYFTSTWAISKDEENLHIAVFNIGNQKTCNIQGFMIQFGAIGAAFYSMCLSVFFYLCVRERRRNIRVLKKAEPIFHLISMGYPLVTAIAGVIGGNFNAMSVGCWISEYPLGCVDDECIRGENAQKLRVFGMILPLVICIVVITVSMILLYKVVKRQEETMIAYTRRWSEEVEIPSRTTQQNNRSRKTRRRSSTSSTTTRSSSERVLRQAKLYVGAFVAVWLPGMFQMIIFGKIIKDPSKSFYTKLIGVFFAPFQGFFNALIYARCNPLVRLLRVVASLRCRHSSLTANTNDEDVEVEVVVSQIKEEINIKDDNINN